MSKLNVLKATALSFAASFALGLVSVPAALSQQVNGPIPLPPAKPRVNQLGSQEPVPVVDKTILFLGLFLQVMASIGVAIALASHWSMPPRQKRL